MLTILDEHTGKSKRTKCTADMAEMSGSSNSESANGFSYTLLYLHIQLI